MIVLIGGEKGGTGKSTLASNLAAWLACAGHDVLLLDADRQNSSANWAAERAEHAHLPVVHCLQRHGNLFPALTDLQARYGEIIIDAGGRDSEEFRSAMTCADKLYSPLRASQADLWTVEHLIKLVTLARSLNPKLEASVLLSMAPTNPRIKEVQEACELLEQFSDVQLANTVIHERKAFRDAFCDGRGAVELTDPKATQEIESLAKEIYGG